MNNKRLPTNHEIDAVTLGIGNYSFSVADEPDSNNVQVWIRKIDGESMGMALYRFNEMMDQVWRERV